MNRWSGRFSIEMHDVVGCARLAFMDMVPLLIIFGAVVLIGLIWAALRLTIKRDTATIKADMDEPEEVEEYKKRWRKHP